MPRYALDKCFNKQERSRIPCPGATPNDPLDLAALLRQPRHAEPAPDATEVRLAIEERLLPTPVYRVAWRVDSKNEAPFRWEPGEG